MAATPTYLLGSIPINTGIADSNGVCWFAFDLEGWDAADTRGQLVETIGAGEIPAGINLKARVMTFTKGFAHCPSEAARQTARDTLASALSISNPTTLVVSEAAPKQISVLRWGKTVIVDASIGVAQPFGPSWPFSWQLPMLASDPRKLATAPTGPTAFSAGSVTVNNPGDYPAGALIALTGVTDPCVITNTTIGQAIHLHDITGTNPPPSALTVNTDVRTIVNTAGGANRFDLRAAGTTWWQIAPGNNTITISGASGGTVTFTPTWL